MAATTAVLLGAAGCSSGDTATDETAAADTIHPTGSDSPGSLVIHLPPGGRGRGLGLVLDDKPVSTDEVIGGVSVGTHRIGASGLEGTVTVEANRTTTYDLAAVVIAMPKEPTFGLNEETIWNGQLGDGAKRWESKVYLRVDKSVRVLNEHAALHDVMSDGKLFVVPQGQFSVSFGFGDGTSAVATPGGKTTTIDLGDLRGRHLTRLVAPSRALPNGYQPFADVNTWQVHQQGTANRSTISVGDQKTILVGTNDSYAKRSTISFKLGDDAWSALAGSELAGSAPSERKIARLDVTDVAVTNGGTTSSVRGAYRVERSHVSIVGSVPTGTGVDVWPGTYTVTTTYSTLEASSKTTSQTVTVE